MSININGDKIAKFGKNLPTMYIDKIEVFEKKIVVSASCYFLKPEHKYSNKFNDYVDGVLENIFWTMILIPEGAQPNSLIRDLTSDFGTFDSYGKENFNNVFNINNENMGFRIEKALKQNAGNNVFELMRHASLSFSDVDSGAPVVEPSFLANDDMIVFPKPDNKFHGLFYMKASEALTGKDTMYDDSGSTVFRYRFEQEFNISNDDHREYSTSGTELFLEAMLKGKQTFNLISFSTSLLMAGDALSFSALYAIPESTTAYHGRKDLFVKQISDITYETVSTNGKLASMPRMVFKIKDTNENYIVGDVLQSFDSLYYTDTGIKRKDILNIFNNLINDAQQQMDTNISVPTSSDRASGFAGVDTSERNALKKSIDNLQFILVTNGKDIDLIPKLRKFEKTFPGTSTMTDTGAFYQKFRDVLYNVNIGVKNGKQLLKSLNLNTIVKDSVSVSGHTLATSLTSTRPKDKDGRYVKSLAMNYETPASEMGDDGKIPGQALYCCYSDPVKYEFYPAGSPDSSTTVGANLQNLLNDFSLDLSEFLPIDFVDYAAVMNKMREIMKDQWVYHLGRDPGSDSAAGAPSIAEFNDLPSYILAALIMELLAKSYVDDFRGGDATELDYSGDASLTSRDPDAAGAVTENEAATSLINDVTAMGTTKMNTIGIDASTRPSDFLLSDLRYATEAVFSSDELRDGAWERETGVGIPEDSDAADWPEMARQRLRLRFVAGGGIGDTPMMSLALDLKAALGALGLEDSGPSSYMKLFEIFTKDFSSKLYLPFQEHFYHPSLNPEGRAPWPLSADSSSTDYDADGHDSLASTLAAIRDPDSRLCQIYGFSILYYFLQLVASDENGAQYHITERNEFLNGYWWFDYEKALNEQSAITYIFDADNLATYYGSTYWSDFYKVKFARVRRYHQKYTEDRRYSYLLTEDGSNNAIPANIDAGDYGDHQLELAGTIEAVFNEEGSRVVSCNIVSGESELSFEEVTVIDSMGDLALPGKSMYIKVNTEPKGTSTIEGSVVEALGHDVHVTSGDEYTYLINRAFAVPSLPSVLSEESFYDPSYPPHQLYAYESVPGYRLMCFEHQEVAGPFTETDDLVEGSSEFPYSFLHHEVEIFDQTARIAGYIIKEFMDMFKIFKEYSESASEECNYNVYDGTFSDEYKDAIETLYGGSSTSTADRKPWLMMPLLYHIHLDLLYNSYGGDRSYMFSEAFRDSQKVSPRSGTLDEILQFITKVQTLIDEQYTGAASSTAYITDSVADRLDKAGFPGFVNPIDLMSDTGDVNRIFQNGGTFGSTTDPMECQAFANIPIVNNFAHTLGDIKPSPIDLLASINSIKDYGRILVTHYTKSGNNHEHYDFTDSDILTWAALAPETDYRIPGTDLYLPMIDFFNYEDTYTMVDRSLADSVSEYFDKMIGLDDGMDLHIVLGHVAAGEDAVMIVGEDITGIIADTYIDFALGPITAAHFTKKAFELIIEYMNGESGTYPRINFVTDDDIDAVHRHALLRNRGLALGYDEYATALDAFGGVVASEKDHRAMFAIAKIKSELAKAFYHDLKNDEAEALVDHIRELNTPGYISGVDTATDLFASTTARSMEPFKFYMDYTTHCDDLVATILACMCVMARRTPEFQTKGSNPEGFGVDDLLAAQITDGGSASSFEDYVIDSIFSDYVYYYGKTFTGTTIEVGGPSFSSVYSEHRPELLDVFRGVYSYAGGHSTIQLGYDTRDDMFGYDDSYLDIEGSAVADAEEVDTGGVDVTDF